MTAPRFPPTAQVCRVEKFATNLVYELTGTSAHTVSEDMGAIIRHINVTVGTINVYVPFEWVHPLTPLAADMLASAKEGLL